MKKGLLIVEVKIGVAVVVVAVVLTILLPDFIQLQITSNGNKTVNIYVKKLFSLYTEWSKKMAQSLWHHNFATVHHRVMRFSAKCSEGISLHDLIQCLNTAVKYFLFLPLASKLLKNSTVINVPWSIKTCHYYFFK